MNEVSNIFEFIKSQEAVYKQPVPINDSWSWSMMEHIKLTVLYKNSQLKTGKNDFKPVKNITRPILNLQYRAEGFDVKDIVLFINDSKEYFKSLLVKKFHQKWALENAMDTFIDAVVESFVDFGGALVKNVNDVKPEVVPLQSIAFCDQTDILSGPIGIKHFFSPDQLLDMASRGWGNTSNGASASLEETITLAQAEKVQDTQAAKTPGKYIEVYEIHGNLPKKFLDDNNSQLYVNQMQIICFYQKKDSTEKGFITLYKAEEKKSPFKFIARDAIYGRALGMGGAEELFEPQVWINYNMIRMQDMLDAASKTILKSTDPTVAQKNKVRDMENLQILELAPNTDINQVDTFPRNIKLFENSNAEWETHAQQMGSANDSIMGESPTAGTPFKLQELVTQESHSLHEYRKGKLAAFLDEVYREWIIPHMVHEITKGQEFLAELDLDELNYVADALVNSETNRMIKEKVLSGQMLDGEVIDPQLIEGYKEIVRDTFKKKGNKHFIKILQGEFKGKDFGIRMNIAGKQKNLAGTVDKISNVVRMVLQAGGPTALAFPGTWDLINQTVEQSGLNPVDFAPLADAFKKLQQQQAQQPAQNTQNAAPAQEVAATA